MTARYVITMLMLLAIGIAACTWIYSQMEEQDTSYQCRPGAVYTTMECE